MTDIQTIAQDYPVLMKQILARATGQLGEYIVSEALRSRGYATTFTTNDEQLDLHVTAPDGRTFTVEVKTGRTRSAWWVRKRPWRSEFWVFVYAPKTPFIDNGQVNFDDPAKSMADAFKKACNDAGVAFIDLTRDFEEFYRKTGKFSRGFNNGFISRGHWNAHGHRLVAKAIVKYLLEPKNTILTD